MRPLFISYRRNPWGAEALRLSTECRRRGLRTVVDVSDPERITGQGQYEAIRRVIQDECDGFILYATRNVVDSACIWNVEVPAALAAFDRGNFDFVPVFRDLSPSEVASLEPHGRRISALGGITVRVAGDPVEDAVAAAHGEVASVALRAQLRRYSGAISRGGTAIAVRTRQTGVQATDADLLLDWTGDYEQILGETGSDDAGLGRAMRDVSRAVAATGARAVRLCGPAHLSAGFAMGFTFARASGFQLEVAHRDTWWRADGDASHTGIRIIRQQLDPGKSGIVLTMAISRPEIVQDVDAAVGVLGLPVGGRIVIEPVAGARREAIEGDTHARAIVHATAEALMRARAEWGSRGAIHIFMAAPFAFATLLGHALNGFGTLCLYEPRIKGHGYIRVLVLPYAGNDR